MSKNSNFYEDLFSSLISDIKNYSGKDPLLPWLRGIRRMKEILPQQDLKGKLPRFLQKCGQTFLNDRRYANDLRYVRIWIQLMDFVDDPKSVLKTMETHRIGTKKALFYQAYALYYEKMKKFESAERMYYLGVQNLAEPSGELQKSHEQFLSRMERHKKKIQVVKSRKSNPTAHPNDAQAVNSMFIRRASDDIENTKADDTIVGKFVKTAVVGGGKSEAEDARHHGLVEPTINTREAMDVINDMFKEPLEPSFNLKRSSRNEPKEDLIEKTGQEVQTGQEPLQIFVDDMENDSTNEADDDDDDDEDESGEGFSGFVLSRPSDNDQESEKPNQQARLHREDTVVHRFVGSTVLHEPPRVENACHHGLVEPTINLKEAMDDINSMFGKPIEFVRKSRPKKPDNAPPDTGKKFSSSSSSFSILPDEDLSRFPSGKSASSSLTSVRSSLNNKENDWFEETVCTKEAIDEINKMFGMPLDF